MGEYNPITGCNHGWDHFDEGCWACVEEHRAHVMWRAFAAGLVFGGVIVALVMVVIR